LKHDEIYVNRKKNNDIDDDRKYKKQHLGEVNKGPLPKTNNYPEKMKFVQKKIFFNPNKSDLIIPGYGNSQLNGKGFSYNRLPYERFDDTQDQ